MDLELTNRHGIVVGGSRGIGKAIARQLAEEGMDLVLVARDPERLHDSAQEIAEASNRRVYPVVCDVTDRLQVEAMVEQAIHHLGDLHVLINSGSAPGGSATATGYIDTIVDEDFLDDFNVKYMGALRCARACIPICNARVGDA